jgi:diamine N-acetyltransferase
VSFSWLTQGALEGDGGRLRPLAPDETVLAAAILAGIDPWRRLGMGSGALTGYLTRDDPALARLGLERDGRLAGVLALRWPWLRGPSVELMAIFPGHQGVGLGRAVVSSVSRDAAAVTANLWACVSAFNAPARAFWSRCGFAEVAALPGLVRPEEDEILLRRRLR